MRARPSDRVSKIATICIPTADRIPAFERAARSYLENTRTFGRSPELVVADDSAEASVRAQYRQLLAQLAGEFAVPVYYAGAEEKEAYIGALARESSVPRALIEFALLDPLRIGYHPGANRNALLLHTAGRPFFCADDDTICRPVSTGESGRRLRLWDGPDATTVHPYPNFESLEADLDFREIDLLGAHERVLGSDIGSLLHGYPEVAAEIRHPGIMRALHENVPQVTVSWCGIAGDCGYRIPAFLFNLPKAEMERFTRDEETYRKTLASRQIHRFCDRLTIGFGGYCQSTALAFDNRQPLPPFFPVLRGEDMVFGQVLNFMRPHSAIAYQPVSLLHVPQVARESSREILAEIARHRSQTGLVVTVLQIAVGLEGRTETPNVAPVLRRARQIVQSDWFELLARNIHRMETAQMGQSNLLQLLAAPSALPAWRTDLGAMVRLLDSPEITADYIHPGELSRSFAPPERMRVLRLAITGYFELVEVWPALVTAAQRLRDKRQITLAQVIAPAQ